MNHVLCVNNVSRTGSHNVHKYPQVAVAAGPYLAHKGCASHAHDCTEANHASFSEHL